VSASAAVLVVVALVSACGGGVLALLGVTRSAGAVTGAYAPRPYLSA
jgi:hypothetical protein